MTKQLNLTLEEAIKYYNSSNDMGFKELLEQNFGKGFWKSKEIQEQVYNLPTLTHKLGHSPLIYHPPTTSFERYINACSVLALVASLYNEGTKLDWNNTNEYKYVPYKYFSFGGGGSEVYSSCAWCCGMVSSGRFYYKSAKLSEASYNNFKEYWEDFWSV